MTFFIDFSHFTSSLAKISSEIQVWVKPISPVIKGTFSYAVAWTSKRDDGAPYAIQTSLAKLGLVHEDGYLVTVQKQQICPLLKQKSYQVFFFYVLGSFR